MIKRKIQIASSGDRERISTKSYDFVLFIFQSLCWYKKIEKYFTRGLESLLEVTPALKKVTLDEQIFNSGVELWTEILLWKSWFKTKASVIFVTMVL